MKSLRCKEIRDLKKYQACSCLHPVDDMRYQVDTLVTWRGITIYMKYLEKHEDLRLYHVPDRGTYYLMKGRTGEWTGSCPPTCREIMGLIENKMLLLHSIFCQMMKSFRRVPDAAVRAAAAAHAREALKELIKWRKNIGG